jgi:hypothetical protein
LCGPGPDPDNTALSLGSTATTLMSGFLDFKYRPAPVMVPPVLREITESVSRVLGVYWTMYGQQSP